MLSRLLGLLRSSNASRPASAIGHIELPKLSREQISHLMMVREGLPQIDWGMAEAWATHECARLGDGVESEQLCRAIAAAWLDELRDALPGDYRRWRNAAVEGLAPVTGDFGARVAGAVDRSLPIIAKSLAEIRGDPKQNPIPPIAVIVLDTADEYYSFISHFYPEEGAFATSGGIYIRDADNFPALVVNAQTKYEIERTIAHELTHHALKPANPEIAIGLPIWAEEGFTQMMEEHVTREARFAMTHEMRARHRELWEQIGFEGFAAGETIHSPEGEEQELSYHLAEALTRWLSMTRKKDFFAFARACLMRSEDHESLEREYLGASVQELAEQFIGNM